jgi:hypothetical protein
MPLANIDAADLIFGLLFPPIETLVVYGGGLRCGESPRGWAALSKVTKKVLKWGAVFVLGVGYDMSLTKFLEWSPQTQWTSLPVWFCQYGPFSLSVLFTGTERQEVLRPLAGEVAFGCRRGHVASGHALRAATQ